MDRAKFYARLRARAFTLFGTNLSKFQVGSIEAILDGLEARRVPLNQSAYILATGYHEADKFKTREEYASGAAYEGRKTLGNTQKGDGKRYKGRGFVQITGRRNYTDWAKRLGADLVNSPALASQTMYAVPILIDGMRLGTFTTKKLGTYVNASKTDYINARRTVNGTDRASLIAGHAKKFAKVLAEVDYGVWAADVVPPPVVAPAPVAPPPKAQPTKVVAPVTSGAAGAAAGAAVQAAGFDWWLVMLIGVVVFVAVFVIFKAVRD